MKVQIKLRRSPSVAVVHPSDMILLNLAHVNCTLFCTPRAAFVCIKKTHNFPVFAPEN